MVEVGVITILNSTTQAAHWAHRNNSTLLHKIQIIDLSGLVTTFSGPEINIQGNDVTIPNGNAVISLADFTDFGNLETTGGVSTSHTFTIQNLGSTDVTLNGISPYVVITGDIDDFILTANPTTPIIAGGSTTFTITYNPTTSLTHLATVSILNNDSDEDPYTFIIGGKGEYCSSNGSTTYNTSVTYVSFNTLSNADNEIPKDNGYEDFTNMSTNVYKNSTHNLTVKVNTDGNYTIYTRAWFDWNRDGDFLDAGEEYDMGSATNVTDGPPTGSPLAITIPNSAVIGLTGMRIATKWLSYPSSCDTGFDGEVEDYSINIIDYLIDFDGVDQLIDFEDNHDLTSSFSLQAWVLQEATVANGTILSKGNIDATVKTGYHLAIKNNYPNLIWYDNSNNQVLNITSLFEIPNNKWHHISATYDGTTARLYIDGIEVISGLPSAAPLNTAQSFKIGAETTNYTTTPSNINFYNGAIQEVRIWDVALSEVQIREMMNQSIEQNVSAVKGLTVPLNISGGLLWSNLRGYYPLSSNTAFDSSSYAIQGVLVNINSSQSVTAPIPYETDSNGNWDSSTTWLNGTNIKIPNTTGIDGSTNIDWNIVELTNNITSGNRNISLLGLISKEGKLTIHGTIDINTGTGTGQSLTISHYLELDGIIDLEGESQLIQSEGSIIDADSGGHLERDQQGTANSFNYNYWSSSVGLISGNSETTGIGVENTNSNFSISGVLNDGTISSSSQAITFNPSFSAADSNTPPIPISISTYWLYKFYGASDDFNAWTSIDETSSLLVGEGYTMKGTSGAANILTDFQNYIFKGIPNNGDVTLTLDKSLGEVDRLIGNPYPSAIDATAFILDNLSVADGGTNVNGTIFNGALYFWDHFGEVNSHSTSDFIGGYATRNLTCGAAAISNDIRIDDTGASGTKVPGQYIPVNQGFFVTTALDGFNNDSGVPISVVDGGDIVFKNSQRVFATEGSANSVFMRSSENNESNTNANEEEINSDKPIIRLMFDSPKGYHRQIVIGIAEVASNSFDFGYDAFMNDVNQEDMYWTFDGGKFVIQGVNNFNETQEFSLGLIVSEPGLVRISIDALENIDPSLNIFIKDNSTGETFQINSNPFEINLEAGTYDDRFKVVFQSNSLTTDKVYLKDGLMVYYDAETSKIKIKKIADIEVLDITIYNIIGQRIKSLDFNSRDIAIPIHVNTGVYILQFNTTSGIISKRIIIK